MKKYLIYVVVFFIGIGVFFLQFGYGKKYHPYTLYQVYLDDERIGIIESKEELEGYIRSQGDIIKEQVEKYTIDVDRYKIVQNIFKKIIDKDNKYYNDYKSIVDIENIYNKIFELVDNDGNLEGDYDTLKIIYENLSAEYKTDSSLTQNGIQNYNKFKEKINNSIKSKKKNIVNNLYINRDNLKLTSSEYSGLEYFVDNRLIDIGYTKYMEMKEFIDYNNIYLYSDNIYEPLGINIKKVVTYNNESMPVKEVYDSIVDKKPCTIEGYQFRIKKTNGVHLDNNAMIGALSHTDYELVKSNATEDIIIYVTDPDVFNAAIEEITTVFVGSDEYEAYKNNTQKEIVDTGTKIENIYLKEEITIKETNISVKEKIYNDSSDLASYLLYGDSIQTSTVYASANDSINDLAYKNGISIEEFFLSNPSFTSINNIFYDGQPITITKLNPNISLVVEESQVEDKSIDYKTIEKYDNTMILGSEKVEQEGSKGLMRVSQKVQKVNGSISFVNLVSNETIKNSKDKIVLVGTKEIPNVGSTTSWGWPTNSGYTLTSYFGWRAYPFSPSRKELHAGLDIAGTGYGSPIYASNNGTIESIKSESWNYGNSIIINHNNGYWTNYGHMSRFAPGLKVGDTVARGQIIGYMGHSGAATGTHLHFEIRVGSNRYSSVTNPLPYLMK